MATGQLGNAMTCLRRLLRAHDLGGLTDRQLLQGFQANRDEAAFEELVRRHGPMVLGVCQRVLHDAHAAEDAFQATFLVLVRKAGSLSRPDLLGNWLYGVAYRTAKEARSRAVRRRTQELQAMIPTCADPPRDDWSDLRPVLDEELSRLPDRYRVPVVLCDLEGRGRSEVARLIGCPEGTLSSRLARAREILRKRLARRGVVLSAGGLVLALSPGGATATVPPALLGATVKAAALVAAGEALAGGVVSAPVAALTEGVIRAMLTSKIKIAAAVLLAVGGVATGVGVLTHKALAEKPAADKKEAPADAAKPAKPAKPATAKPAGDKPAKPDKDEGDAVFAVIKAVDLGKRTITVLVRDKDKKDGTEQTFTLSGDAKVFLPGKGRKTDPLPEGKLTDLSAGVSGLLRLSADKKAVVAIHVNLPHAAGVIKSVDAAKGTVTVNLNGKKQQEEQTLTLAADTKVFLPGTGTKEAPPQGTLADLKEGTPVSLILSADRKTVHSIAVSSPSIQGRVASVDVGNNTITISTKGDGDKTFTVAKDARISLAGSGKDTAAKLSDVPQESSVSLQLSLDRQTVLAIAAYGPSLIGTVTAIDNGTWRITVNTKSDGDVTYPLAKDLDLTDVAEGKQVSLRLSVDKQTVVAISVNKNK
jgi:RNA polymerase sigma factor (sigma-70 family)